MSNFFISPTSHSVSFFRFKDGVPHTPLQQRAAPTFTCASLALYPIYTTTRVPHRERFRNVRQGLELVFRSGSDHSDPGQGFNRRNTPLLNGPSFFRSTNLIVLLVSDCSSDAARYYEPLTASGVGADIRSRQMILVILIAIARAVLVRRGLFDLCCNSSILNKLGPS